MLRRRTAAGRGGWMGGGSSTPGRGVARCMLRRTIRRARACGGVRRDEAWRPGPAIHAGGRDMMAEARARLAPEGAELQLGASDDACYIVTADASCWVGARHRKPRRPTPFLPWWYAMIEVRAPDVRRRTSATRATRRQHPSGGRMGLRFRAGWCPLDRREQHLEPAGAEFIPADLHARRSGIPVGGGGSRWPLLGESPSVVAVRR